MQRWGRHRQRLPFMATAADDRLSYGGTPAVVASGLGVLAAAEYPIGRIFCRLSKSAEKYMTSEIAPNFELSVGAALISLKFGCFYWNG